MTTPRARSVLPILFFTLLLDTISYGIIIPIIPILFTDPSSPHFLLHGYSTGDQLFLAGLITAVFGFMQFVASPILGEFSDVYGRKKLLTVGVGILAFSQLLFGAGIALGLLWVLFAARTIAGLAAANFSIALATIADVTAPKDRAKNFGLIGAAFGIGLIVGPFLAGWITALTNDPATAFWFAGMLGTVNLMFISLFLRETHNTPSAIEHFTFLKGFLNIKAAIRDHTIRFLYLTSFLYMSGFAAFTSFIGILLVDNYHYTEADVGTYFAVVGVCMFITQGVIIRVLMRYTSEAPIMRVSIPVVAVVILLYPFMPNGVVVYFLAPLFAVPQGLIMASLNALISRQAEASKQGAALGINSSLRALSQGLVPLTVGFAASALGVSSTFFFGSAVAAASWIVFVFYAMPHLKSEEN